MKSGTYANEKQDTSRVVKHFLLGGLYLGRNSITTTENLVNQEYVNKHSVIC